MTSLRLPELLRQQSFNVPAAETENTASVIAELTQVHGLVRKLAAHLESPHIDLCRTLAREIIFSIEKAIHTAKSTAENPLTDVGSQLAEIPNKAFDAEQSRTKHRKMLPQWSSHVSMSSGTAQGVPDDGRTWRKYGQKGILGAKYPRAYYRCTHRKTQGCPATKQVQRSDENPAVFDIIYRGTHICSDPTQQTTAAVMRSHRQQNIWAQKTEGTNSVCQYPSSSFSLPSSSMSSSTLGLKSHHGFAEIISAANDDTDFMDLGIMFEVGDMVGELPYDASAFFI